MAENTRRGVFIPRHDIEANWLKAVNFIPSKSEMIVYEPDAQNTSFRFKFGDGVNKVSDLPFVSTGSGGTVNPGDIDLEGVATEEWVKDYIENINSIQYLQHEERTGHRIELPDIFPIQTEAEFKLISRNRFVPYQEPNPDGSVTVSLTTAGETQVVGTAKLISPDTYKAALYSFVDEYSCKLTVNGYKHINGARTYRFKDIPLGTPESPTEIDAKLLDVEYIEIVAHALSGFSHDMQISVELASELSPNFYAPKTDLSSSEVVARVYQRNLLSPASIDIVLSQVTPGSTVQILQPNSGSVACSKQVNAYGAQLVHGRATDSTGVFQLLIFNSVDEAPVADAEFNVPLVEGDRFTFIFKCTPNTDDSTTAAIMLGEVTNPAYEDYSVQELTATNGTYDIEAIQYPYSLVALDESDYNGGYSLYMKWDAALTRNWVEQQIDNIETTKEQLVQTVVQTTSTIKNNFANAIKGTATGTTVTIDDISPVEHDVKVTVTPEFSLTFSNIRDNGPELTGTLPIDSTSNILMPYKRYKVLFDGKEYVCSTRNLTDGAMIIGNGSKFSMEGDTTAPFMLLCEHTVTGATFDLGYTLYVYKAMLASELKDTYTIQILEEDTKLTVNNSKNLIDYISVYQNYTDINEVGVATGRPIDFAPEALVVPEAYRNKTLTFSAEILVPDDNLNVWFDVWSTNSDRVTTTPSTSYSHFNRITWTYEPSSDYTIESLQLNCTDVTAPISIQVRNVQLEFGNSATEYERYVAPSEYIVNADGTVDNLKSTYPQMTMTTNNDLEMSVEYSVDTNKTIGNIEDTLDAIIALQQTLIGG